MCGIAGRLSSDSKLNNEKIVLDICNRMIHRGPDFGCVKSFGSVTLGHRRLAIIDLSAEANQPMTLKSGRFSIVFNGEIYNYQDIRTELISLGYHFFTNSDTEVLLNSYQQWGKNCLNKFNGMFAFAIWDEKEQCLFLARDRFGKKPLFYSFSQNTFTFASETYALLADTTISNSISLEAVNCYLALGYILNPMTMYKHINLLEPGSYIIISKDLKIFEKSSYWNYADSFYSKTTENEHIIAHNILELLTLAVKRRMISDVPIGAFLSGGIDSSSVVSLMKKYHVGDLHTFSVGFDQNNYNELPDADRVGKNIGTIHHGIIVNPKENSHLLEEGIQASDQLFSDNSILPMIEVSKLASKYITVVLSGDGADEMFGGYITYSADKYYNIAKLIPYPIRYLLSSQKIKINPFSTNKINLDYKRQQFFNGTLYNYQKAHYLWRCIFNEEERIKILGEKYREIVYDTDPFRTFAKLYTSVSELDIIDQHLFVDAMTWLTDDILVKVDRSTMYNSIEARAPYLDIDLVNYSASIPASIKMKNGVKKYILKLALKNTLPKYVLKKKKSGFNAPIHTWIEDTETNEFKSFTKYVFQTRKNSLGTDII